MEKPPLQPIGFIENVPPAPPLQDEVIVDPEPVPIVNFTKIPPLPQSVLKADTNIVDDRDADVLPTDVVHTPSTEAPVKEQEPISPEAEKFYNDEYQRVRLVVHSFAEGHSDAFGELNDTAARFVKSHFENPEDAREYVLHHVCCGSSPDPKTLRYLDTEDNDFYKLIKTHTGIDVYAEDEEDEENR